MSEKLATRIGNYKHMHARKKRERENNSTAGFNGFPHFYDLEPILWIGADGANLTSAQ